MYNIITANITNIMLVGLVILVVMFSKNGQSRSSQLDIKTMVMIGLSLIMWFESELWGRLIGGESLIREYGIMVTIVGVIAVLLMDREKEKKGIEKVGLILLSTLGMIILVSGEDLLSIYLGMELQSLGFYTLAGYRRKEQYSAEAGLKYFILGALASGIYLLGVSLIYGITGLTNLIDIEMYINTGVGNSWALVIGGISIVVALLFKVGVAPFHMWLPDVYQGAPTAVTALFAITPKISIIILILRLYLTTFYGLFFELSVLFFICSILSMGIGAVGALNQSFIKRLLAYSAIAHTGYILLSLSVGTYTSIFSLLVYMVVYIITTVSVFTTLLALPSHVSSSNNFLYLIGFTGLSRYNPVLAATLLISLLSLAGVPPLSGFFGKWLLFSSAIHSEFYLLSIFAALSSVLSAFYYLRLIKLLYFQDSPFFHSTVLINTLSPLPPISLSSSFLLAISTFLSLFFIFFPTPLYLLSHLASLSFFL